MNVPRIQPEQPRALRLVFPDHGVGIAEADARRAVEGENRRAAGLAARGDARAESDVRRIFAWRAAQSLEGGRAAILRPDSRRRLVSEARRFGLRAFEANLIIAVVQDSARRGESPDNAATRRTLDVIPSGVMSEDRQLLIQRMIVAAIIGAVLLAGLIRWVTGG